MPLAIAKLVWSSQELNGPVLVQWGNITGVRPDLVAAAGNKVYLFSPAKTGCFLSAVIDVGEEVLSLEAGLPINAADNIVIGLDDRLVVYGSIQGTLVKLFETDSEPGARFIDLALADLDGDGRQEIVAAAEGNLAFFVYELFNENAEGLSLELRAIRLLPGPPRKVTVMRPEEEQAPVIAVAYDANATSGIATFIFTEIGFIEGPFQDDLPARVSSLTAGDLRLEAGDELAWGGADGLVRVVEVDGELATVLTTENLGSDVPALTTGELPGEERHTLVAGTPEGFLFGFRSPVEQASPDWAVRAGRPVNDLSISEEGLLGVGTSDGGVQVWFLSSQGTVYHVVKPGETLNIIAGLYKAEASIIAEINRLADPGLIFPGQVLIIP